LRYACEMRLSRPAVSISALLVAAIAAATTPPAFRVDDAKGAVDGQRVSQPAGPRKQVLAIIPDRTTGRDWGLRYLAEAVEDFNRTEPDAVFCVGDLVQGYSRDHAHVRRERDDFLGIVRRLRMPFYPTPGNHDLVSGGRDAKDRSFADEYRTLFGPLYYSVELELASVVILNTEDGEGQIQPGFSDTQLSWLDRELETLARRGRPIILLFHRPLWDHKPTRWDERVQPMLVKHGVDYVIAGHYHSLQWLPPRDGIPYLLLGTCGGAVDQHPLAGQLQHTTYVVVDEAGSVRPYHQVAGCTLPLDWITKEDQDRAYRLKGARDAVRISGAVADPTGRAVESSLEVTLKNPLDREVEFRFMPSREPTAWPVDDIGPNGPIRRTWTSLTPIDTFNPSTTDLRSPFELALPETPIRLAAGAQTTVQVDVRCDAQAAPPQPAPFEIVANYLDSKGRSVPIVLRQRTPIARTIALADAATALAYPIAVWNWSEYDTPDANASATFVRDDARGAFVATVDVPDTVFSSDAKPRDARATIDDPLGDAVRLVLGEGPEAREYLVTFAENALTPVVRRISLDGKALEPTDAIRVVLLQQPTAWRLELAVSPEALPEGMRGAAAEIPINLGVADNDQTYHTQWRWLAPRELPARLKR
jgi:predicted phosphodiesterase